MEFMGTNKHSFKKLNKTTERLNKAKLQTKYIIDNPHINIFNYWYYKVKWFIFGATGYKPHKIKN